jgi:hypothetical protein
MLADELVQGAVCVRDDHLVHADGAARSLVRGARAEVVVHGDNIILIRITRVGRTDNKVRKSEKL